MWCGKIIHWGNNEVLVRASNNSGTTFGPSINLSNNSGTSSSPQISSCGVVWQDDTLGNNEIFFSQNSGTTFGPTINLSNNAGSSSSPQISSCKVVWEDNNNQNIFYRSGTSGPTYNLVQALSSPGPYSDPQISSSGNNVYVVWQGFINFNSEIILAASNDGGNSFNILINLSNDLGISFNPQISSSGNNVHVVWQDNSLGNNDILIRASNNGATTFGNTINLSSNPGTSQNQQIVSSGNNPYVVWEDNSLGNFEILFKNTNAAINLTINLSNTTGNSLNSQVSVP